MALKKYAAPCFFYILILIFPFFGLADTTHLDNHILCKCEKGACNVIAIPLSQAQNPFYIINSSSEELSLQSCKDIQIRSLTPTISYIWDGSESYLVDLQRGFYQTYYGPIITTDPETDLALVETFDAQITSQLYVINYNFPSNPGMLIQGSFGSNPVNQIQSAHFTTQNAQTSLNLIYFDQNNLTESMNYPININQISQPKNTFAVIQFANIKDFTNPFDDPGSLYAYPVNGKAFLVENLFTSNVGYGMVADNLGVESIGTGTGLIYYTFVRFDTQQISQRFFDVLPINSNADTDDLAADPQHLVVVYLGDNNQIMIGKIFNPNQQIPVKLPGISQSIEGDILDPYSISFLDDGVSIQYTDDHGVSQKVLVSYQEISSANYSAETDSQTKKSGTSNTTLYHAWGAES